MRASCSCCSAARTRPRRTTLSRGTHSLLGVPRVAHTRGSVERLTAESEEGMGGVYKALALAHWGTASSAPTELAGFDD